MEFNEFACSESQVVCTPQDQLVNSKAQSCPEVNRDKRPRRTIHKSVFRAIPAASSLQNSARNNIRNAKYSVVDSKKQPHTVNKYSTANTSEKEETIDANYRGIKHFDVLECKATQLEVSSERVPHPNSFINKSRLGAEFSSLIAHSQLHDQDISQDQYQSQRSVEMFLQLTQDVATQDGIPKSQDHAEMAIRFARIASSKSLTNAFLNQNSNASPDVIQEVCSPCGQRRKFAVEFEFLSKVGEGSFGDVLCARHKLDGQCYAIKKIRKPGMSPHSIMNALREVHVLSSLPPHLNILSYKSAWLEDACSSVYIQTEKLDSLLISSSEHIRRFVVDIASALRYLHASNLTHMDVKPSNVLVRKCAQRDSFDYVLIDFGLARKSDASLKEDTEGDARYLCPLRMELSCAEYVMYNKAEKLCAIDIFALGVSAVELALKLVAERVETESDGLEVSKFLKSCKQQILSKALNESKSKFLYWVKKGFNNDENLLYVIRKCTETEPRLRITAVDICTILQYSCAEHKLIQTLQKELNR